MQTRMMYASSSRIVSALSCTFLDDVVVKIDSEIAWRSHLMNGVLVYDDASTNI